MIVSPVYSRVKVREGRNLVCKHEIVSIPLYLPVSYALSSVHRREPVWLGK